MNNPSGTSDQCSAEFLTDISLKRHIILQHDTEPPKEFRCDKCAQDFTGFRYLLIHFRQGVNFSIELS